MLADPYQQKALALLGDTLHEPVSRSRRIVELYARMYLEEPFLNRWFGLACFVGRQIHWVLNSGEFAPHLELIQMLGRGNLVIYQSIMGATLQVRDGAPLSGPLAPGFSLLQEADRLAETDLEGAEAKVRRALSALCQVEQRVYVQPEYDTLPPAQYALLDRVFMFRLGFDTGAPVLRFRGKQIVNADIRCRWMEEEVLPVYLRWYDSRREWLRADVDRIRRWAARP